MGARRKTKSYPGSIERRGRAWRVRLCVEGQYLRFTFHGTKAGAQNFATEKYAELAKQEKRLREGKRLPPRFSELWAEFEAQELPALSPGTRTSYTGSYLRAFEPFFVDDLGDPKVSDIGRGDVKRFLAWRRNWRVGKDGGVSAHTVARDFRVLKRLLNFALELEDIDANPCTRMKPPKADPRDAPILSHDQFEALLTAAEPNPMLHLYVLLLGETGLRSASEALKLRWDDVDIVAGFVHVRSDAGRRTKNGRSRWVPLTPRLRTALQDHAASYRLAVYDGARTEYVFHHVLTSRKAKAGAPIRSMRRSFGSAARAATLPTEFRPHDLRHRRVTRWLAEGKPAALVQEAMGHSSFQTTLGYAHLAREHLRSLVSEAPAVEGVKERLQSVRG
jgi:integrase